MERWLLGAVSEGDTIEDDKVKELSVSHYNRKALRERYGEVFDVLEDLLVITKISLNESKDSIEKIQKLAEGKFDFEQIKNAAHKVKGTALSMSFDKLASIAIELEGIQPSEAKKVAGLMQELIDEITYLDESIHEL